MVDIILAPDCNALAYNTQDDQIPTVWRGLDQLVGYQVYLDDSVGPILRYRKTINGGLTWAAPVSISTLAIEPGEAHGAYYSRTTPGITNRLIHITWTQANAWVYRSLDTDTDTLGPLRTIMAPGSAQALHVAIGEARNGDLWAGINSNDAAVRNFTRRSINGGATWLDPGGNFIDSETGQDDFFIMPASNTGDNADMWMIYFDDLLNRLELRFWDDSAGTFTTALITSTDWSAQQGAVSVRHSDGHLFIPEHSAPFGFIHDFRFWEVTDATTFTQRTNILTAVTNDARAAITIDQNTGRIFVAWFDTLGSALGSTRSIFSDDGGVNWSPETQFSTKNNGTMRAIWAAQSIAVGDLGRWMPVWQNNPLEDLETNFDNSIALGLPAPGPPVPLPTIVPAGGTYGAAPGAPPGTILYITPDGIEYPLVTPHVTGRFVMSFSGFGTAPIQYISQRGPNQDGESVRDFNLTPRVVQLLERQQFKGRGAWWDGRADILNDLRPNRQLTATAVVTGALRIVTANGDVRDLNVFIQDGPRFEARNVDEWDEWAFEEVLRFIAHDPLWFNPTRVDLTLAFVLDANLVFPITFPIQFGGGLIDVSTNLDYIGTWASLPTIVITGPIDGFTLDNVTTGETLALLQNIGPARTVTIDLAFGQKTIIDDLGNNLLGSLSTGSDLGTFHIAPTPEAPQVVGQPRPTARNVIRLRGSNPTGSTSVQVRFFTRYFGI